MHSIPLAKVWNRCHFVGHVQACPTNPVWPDLTDLHRARQKVPTLYNGTPILTPKFAPSHGGSEPPSNTWSLGPSQVLNPDGISIGSAVFAGLTSVRRYYFAVWTFEIFSELLFRLNTYMPINSIEVRIHLNYKFNLRLSNFIINSSILSTYSRYF